MKLASAGKSWFVVRCTPQREAKAEHELRLAGFETYLPRYRKDVQNRRTKTYVTREFVLMPPYLFVAMPARSCEQHFGFARACDGVESFLGIDGVPARVSGSDVERLQLMETDMQFDDTRAARIHRKEEAVTHKETLKQKFPIGAPIMMDGIFGEVLGVVVGHKKTGRFKIEVNAYGTTLTLDTDPEKLRAAA